MTMIPSSSLAQAQMMAVQRAQALAVRKDLGLKAEVNVHPIPKASPVVVEDDGLVPLATGIVIGSILF